MINSLLLSASSSIMLVFANCCVSLLSLSLSLPVYVGEYACIYMFMVVKSKLGASNGVHNWMPAGDALFNLDYD